MLQRRVKEVKKQKKLLNVSAFWTYIRCGYLIGQQTNNFIKQNTKSHSKQTNTFRELELLLFSIEFRVYFLFLFILNATKL